jgi:hypothetical protein
MLSRFLGEEKGASKPGSAALAGERRKTGFWRKKRAYFAKNRKECLQSRQVRPIYGLRHD